MLKEQERCVLPPPSHIEQLTSDVWDSYYQAQNLASETDIPFAAAMDIVIGKKDSLSLVGSDGTNIEIGPLITLRELSTSTSYKIIEKFKQNIEAERQAKLQSEPPSFSLASIEAKTNFEELRLLIEQWSIKHQETLDRLNIKDIGDLAPYQAILLSMKIVNDLLNYQDGYEEGDLLGVDDLLKRGKALCRHFAESGEFVFRTLKLLQNKSTLVGTEVFYMSAYRTQEIDYIGPHAYIIALVGTEKRQIKITVIDPTWADNYLNQESIWREKIDKFDTRVAAVISELQNQILDINSAENHNSIDEWVHQTKSASSLWHMIILNVLNFNKNESLYFNREQREKHLKFLQQELKSVTGSPKLFLLLLEKQLHRQYCLFGPSYQQRVKEIEMEITQMIDQKLFDPDYLIRDPVANKLIRNEIKILLAPSDTLEEYNKIDFLYYLNRIRLLQLIAPNSHYPDNIKNKLEQLKDKFLFEFKKRVAAIKEISIGKVNSAINQHLYNHNENILRNNIKQVIVGYQEILSLFKLTPLEEENLQTLYLKVNQALETIHRDWDKIGHLEFEEILPV
ncbi:MAG: hypothetical protein ABH896_04445 [Candidatus Jacksonbacteria bacterium]